MATPSAASASLHGSVGHPYVRNVGNPRRASRRKPRLFGAPPPPPSRPPGMPFVFFSFSLCVCGKKWSTHHDIPSFPCSSAPERIKCEVERCYKTGLQKHWERDSARCDHADPCPCCGIMVMKHVQQHHRESVCPKRLVTCPGLLCTQKIVLTDLDTAICYPQFLLADHQCDGVWLCDRQTSCGAAFLDPLISCKHTCVQ